LQAGGDGATLERRRAIEFEQVDEPLVEERRDPARAEPLGQPREPCEKHVALCVRERAPLGGGREATALVAGVERGQLLERRGDVADRHPLADLAPEDERRLPLRVE
jgi:hypothetical protein